MLRVSLAAAALGAALLAMASPAAADEGMWTFENFPAAKVKDAYGVTTDGPWLQRLRRRRPNPKRPSARSPERRRIPTARQGGGLQHRAPGLPTLDASQRQSLRPTRSPSCCTTPSSFSSSP